MGAVYYERAWLRLKAELGTKPSHSARDLLAKMGEIEVECAVPEELDGFDTSPVPPAPRGTSREDMRRDTQSPDARPTEAAAA